MFTYTSNGITCHSSFGIVQIDDSTYEVVNDTTSIHESLFVGTYDECKLYLHYYNIPMYTNALRKYVRNMRDLKLWI